MGSNSSNQSIPKDQKINSVETFHFQGPFPEESNNGLYLCSAYIPEEVVSIILSHVDLNHILNATLVCKKWCNIIKSEAFWHQIYCRKYKKKAKRLPWYVFYAILATDYFDTNFIKNGNGHDEFEHWVITKAYGDQFRVENPPCGADPLPPDVPEFNGNTGCFATSYYECVKYQYVSFKTNKLMSYILDNYKPHIYASEWVAGRFDCGCFYKLTCKLYGYKSHKKESNKLYEKEVYKTIPQWEGSEWSKMDILVDDYPEGVRCLVFQHEGRDTQFWKGHYGSKMAGGVLKILSDSIEPLSEPDCDN